MNVVLLQSVSNVIGRPSAAVGAPIYRTRVHEYPEIILRIYAVGVTIRIISAHQNHLGWLEKRVL
ncbi:hypothetical protein [Prevotella pallens]|uniref:hypothetical protein n=1 Tax=Prevotella pallens TaxID=60133 RepID=UPI00352DB1FA